MNLKDIQDCVNAGYDADIGFAVDKVEPNDIVNYEHPMKRMPDPYGGSYKPDYELLKACGFVSEKIPRT